MTTRKTSRRSKTASSKQTTPRHLWLAALGAFSLVRREARTAAGIALEEAVKLRDNAIQFAGDAVDVARGAAMTAQEQMEPQVSRFSAEVEARLAPVLEKFGMQAPVKKPARKPRKTAKTTTRRGAAARKQAATRVARKGRA